MPMCYCLMSKCSKYFMSLYYKINYKINYKGKCYSN